MWKKSGTFEDIEDIQNAKKNIGKDRELLEANEGGRRLEMAEIFLKENDARHLAEDPSILDPLSDIFDIRNWSMIACDPLSEKNKNEEFFKE